jgi:CheY-like chemotaxis protein
VANVSHELRTPLSAIIGYAQLLRDGDDPPLTQDQRRQVETVLVAAQHLLSMINGLLDIARIEAGRVEVAPVPTDAGELARRACEAIAPLARAKGLHLVEDLPAHSVTAVCDPGHAHQMLLNLLGNAVRFTETGAVAVTVRAEGPWTTVTVADDGPGIPEERLTEIWQQFRQVDGAVSGRHGGTGLGLAITRHLALLQGGVVSCENRPGRGAAFTLALPATPPRGGSPTGADPPPIGARVLVALPDAGAAATVAHWLRGGGHEARVALSARAVEEALEGTPPPACVVLDPTLDSPEGFGLLARLGAPENDGGPAPVLALMNRLGRGVAAAPVACVEASRAADGLGEPLRRVLATASEGPVLIVDRDDGRRERLRRTLAVLGPVGAFAAAPPPDAVGEPPAVIAVDLLAPGGAWALRRALQEAGPDPPAVALIVSTEPTDAELRALGVVAAGRDEGRPARHDLLLAVARALSSTVQRAIPEPDPGPVDARRAMQ